MLGTSVVVRILDLAKLFSRDKSNHLIYGALTSTYKAYFCLWSYDEPHYDIECINW